VTWVARMALVGSAAELVVALIALALAGVWGLVAALIGGGIATSAQIAATALLRLGMKAGTPEFVRRWASGIAIRAVSVVVMVVVLFAARQLLPPLWLALGFLGVLLTLLYAETRFLA